MDFEHEQNPEKDIEKPLKLYRGYVPGSGETRRDSSEPKLIDKIIESGLNPHDEEFADKLIWVTPDERYAGVVALSRALVEMALDPEYKKAVLEKREKIPSIDEYSLPKATQTYDARGAKIVPLTEGESSQQIVIDNIYEAEVSTKRLSENSLKKLEKFLEDKKDSDSFLKPSIILEINTKNSYIEDGLKERGQDAFDLTFEEGVRDMWKYYSSKGVSLPEFKELMGKGLLGMTSMSLSSGFKFE